MIVAVDASILVYLLDEEAAAPVDPGTGVPVQNCRGRVDYLVSSLARQNGKIIVPTPALAEVLVRGGSAGPEWLRLLNSSKHFRIADFDQRAAVECAARLAVKNRKRPRQASPRWKAKFDEQIVAIAAAESASVIYSDDNDIVALVGDHVQVIGIKALPLPPQDAQAALPFQSPSVPGLE